MASTDAELAEALEGVVLAGLAELDPVTRSAYLLHDFFGVDIDDVADIVRQPPTSVGQQVLGARALIQKGSPAR